MPTQLPRVPSLIPSSFATLAIGRDVSITIFTASSLNSGEKLFLGRGNYFTFPDGPSYWMDCPEGSGHLRGPVAGDDYWFAGPFGDQLVEVVGLGGGELAEAEVVADEHGGAGPGFEALVPGGVGAAAGHVGQDAAGFGEADFVPGADGLVAQGAGDEGLADADGAGQDDRFGGGQPAQGGEVADGGGGDAGAGGEVEALEGGLLV